MLQVTFYEIAINVTFKKCKLLEKYFQHFLLIFMRELTRIILERKPVDFLIV